MRSSIFFGRIPFIQGGLMATLVKVSCRLAVCRQLIMGLVIFKKGVFQAKIMIIILKEILKSL
jgi:hypothetical protein